MRWRPPERRRWGYFGGVGQWTAHTSRHRSATSTGTAKEDRFSAVAAVKPTLGEAWRSLMFAATQQRTLSQMATSPEAAGGVALGTDRKPRMKLLPAAAVLLALLGLTQISATATGPEAFADGARRAASVMGTPAAHAPDAGSQMAKPLSEPETVLTRNAQWFVYPHGCDSVTRGLDVIIHFHGAHTTVVPRYLKTGLDAVLVIINKGIGSGAYSEMLAIPSQVDGLLDRIQSTIAGHCGLRSVSIARLALSSWSAGYGATEQFLRFRPGRVDAVLLSDGLHVGFTDPRTRAVRAESLGVFLDFARRAGRGEKLMAVTHSSIKPVEYAGAGETAQVLADAAHAPIWPVAGQRHRMDQLTASRRGEFYAEGYAGTDKLAHSRHLYAIGETTFARLREYWKR